MHLCLAVYLFVTSRLIAYDLYALLAGYRICSFVGIPIIRI
jgi:hypothetical protein